MLSVKDLIVRIRNAAHDEQKTGYTDDILLGYINDGVRIFRRMILENAPMILAEEKAGTLKSGETSVTFDGNVSQILRVLLDQEQIAMVSVLDIDYTNVTGIPDCCYLLGFKTLKFFPADSVDHQYEITYIPDMQLLTLEDSSPFSNDLDDLLFEYAVIRASISNSYDMSQENVVLSTIMAQAEQLIRGLNPMKVESESYWDDYPKFTEGSWNHNHMYRFRR